MHNSIQIMHTGLQRTFAFQPGMPVQVILILITTLMEMTYQILYSSFQQELPKYQLRNLPLDSGSKKIFRMPVLFGSLLQGPG